MSSFLYLESEPSNICFGVFRQEESSIYPPPGPGRKRQWWSPGWVGRGNSCTSRMALIRVMSHKGFVAAGQRDQGRRPQETVVGQLSGSDSWKLVSQFSVELS